MVCNNGPQKKSEENFAIELLDKLLQIMKRRCTHSIYVRNRYNEDIFVLTRNHTGDYVVNGKTLDVHTMYLELIGHMITMDRDDIEFKIQVIQQQETQTLKFLREKYGAIVSNAAQEEGCTKAEEGGSDTRHSERSGAAATATRRF
eukprot:gene19717-26408_t